MYIPKSQSISPLGANPIPTSSRLLPQAARNTPTRTLEYKKHPASLRGAESVEYATYSQPVRDTPA